MNTKLDEISAMLKAIGDPSRLRIIKILASGMSNSICVSDLASKLNISQPAASQHIKILKNVGILEATKDGYRVYYSINTDVLKKHKAEMDTLFELAFKKCSNNGDCTTCKASGITCEKSDSQNL